MRCSEKLSGEALVLPHSMKWALWPLTLRRDDSGVGLGAGGYSGASGTSGGGEVERRAVATSLTILDGMEGDEGLEEEEGETHICLEVKTPTTVEATAEHEKKSHGHRNY